jgi:H-NS histone family protein
MFRKAPWRNLGCVAALVPDNAGKTSRSAIQKETLARVSSLKGRSVPAKYRDKSGNTWAGRGAQPVWLREKLKDGAKLEDFAVHNNAGRHNNSGRVKSRRRAKAEDIADLAQPQFHPRYCGSSGNAESQNYHDHHWYVHALKTLIGRYSLTRSYRVLGTKLNSRLPETSLSVLVGRQGAPVPAAHRF